MCWDFPPPPRLFFLSGILNQAPEKALEVFFSTDVPILRIFIWKFSIPEQQETSCLVPTNSMFWKIGKVLFNWLEREYKSYLLQREEKKLVFPKVRLIDYTSKYITKLKAVFTCCHTFADSAGHFRQHSLYLYHRRAHFQGHWNYFCWTLILHLHVLNPGYYTIDL